MTTPADLIKHKDPKVLKIMKRYIEKEITFEQMHAEMEDIIKNQNESAEAYNRAMRGI